MSQTLPLIKGTLDLLIMKALSVEPTHGYGISVWLEQGSKQQIVVEDSAIYQALRRLEGKRLVTARWGMTENNRKARYYSLTARGRGQLNAEASTWLRYTERVTAMLQSDGGIPGLETS